MSDQAAPEPTMEEILASIRRIISEDDAPGAEAEPEPVAEAPRPAPAPAAPAPAAPAPAPVAARQPAPPPIDDHEEEGDDVLELTQRVEAPKETIGDIDAYAKTEPPPPRPAPEPKPMPKPEAAPARDEDDSLVSLPSAFAAASAFSQLSAAVAMPAQGRTLEDVVREMLKPLLSDWLDQNLSAIVEAKVADEVQRIARRVR